jgi:hypothetical protein
MRLIIAGMTDEVWVRLQPETSEQAVALERSVAQGEWTNGRVDRPIALPSLVEVGGGLVAPG